jgi:hypothetical protein
VLKSILKLQLKNKMMTKTRLLAFLITFTFCSNVFSQTAREREINLLSKTVIDKHSNDSLYIQLRPLPSVRFETTDYIIRFNGKKWVGDYFNNNLKDGKTKIKLKEADVKTLLGKIEFEKLLLPINDSVYRNLSEMVLGNPQYFMIICSRGKVRQILYPFAYDFTPMKDNKETVFWHSTFIESVIKELEKIKLIH